MSEKNAFKLHIKLEYLVHFFSLQYCLLTLTNRLGVHNVKKFIIIIIIIFVQYDSQLVEMTFFCITMFIFNENNTFFCFFEGCSFSVTQQFLMLFCNMFYI